MKAIPTKLILSVIAGQLMGGPPSQGAGLPEARSTNSAGVIPWSQIGARAGADYQGDGMAVMLTESGARLHCLFQRLIGEATREGLWLTSTVTNAPADRFRVMASALGRNADMKSGLGGLSKAVLPNSGQVVTHNQMVRFIRPDLVEEYTVSIDGVRQDFIVEQRPEGAGELRVNLAVNGGQVSSTAYGAQLVLEKSGRKIAYSRLRVTDARGKELPARIEVANASKSEMGLAVVVNDTDALYPVRIDPTFSDANWVSMGGLPGANGMVRAAAADGLGNLYICGDFSIVGDVPARHVAKWNGTSWSAMGSGANTFVNTLAVSGSNVYVGGHFSLMNSVPANFIAKWNGNTWSALGSGLGSAVYALAVSGSDVYAGGQFTTAGGAPANYIAKWDGNAWSPLGEGLDTTVNTLAVSGSDVYAGGFFITATNTGGAAVTVNHIAKFDGTTWSALGSGMNSWVYALAVSDSNVYAGGTFTLATNSGGVVVPADYIAKWNGSVWSALGIGMNDQVSTLAVSGTNLYAGGYFTIARNDAFSAVSANRIARWDGTRWWNETSPGIGSGSVLTLAVSGGDLFVGGNFMTAGGKVAHYIAQWDGDNWSALGTGMNGDVRALAVSGSDLYAGGTFTVAGGMEVNYIAKWDGSSWSALGSGMNGPVEALAVSGSNVYAGGNFTLGVLKWNGSAWSGLGLGLFGPGYVSAIAVGGDDVYVGGNFDTALNSPVSSISVRNIAKWDGNSWSALGSGTDGLVDALAISGSGVYAGGYFTAAGGTNANYIAKWDGSSWSALGLGLNNPVLALAASGSNVYVGGYFTTATNCGGVTVAVNNIAKWDGNAWSALGSGLPGTVFALAVSGSDVYARGYKWDGSDWNALGSGLDPFVYALAVSGNNLYAGGTFMNAGGKVSPYIAKALLAEPFLVFVPGSITVSNGIFHALLSGPESNTVVIDHTTNFTHWTPVATNILPTSGVWQLSLPTGTNSHQFYRGRLGP